MAFAASEAFEAFAELLEQVVSFDSLQASVVSLASQEKSLASALASVVV